jgi:hypothetical protein
VSPGQDRTHLGPAPAIDQEWAADTLESHWTGSGDGEDLHDGGTHVLDVVAAVDHLARGLRHDFTVWDALDEALDWWLLEQASDADGAVEDPTTATGANDADPLRTHMAQVIDLVGHDADTTFAEALQQAIRRWATTMAERFNGGYHWPHPTPRRGFPPRLIDP